jgi:tetratricopeptide (TPR) repeat protein
MQRTLLAISISLLAAAVPSAAQPQPVDWISQMPAIASALGVRCNYCHSAKRGSGEPEPKKEIAFAMMKMTDELNARIRTATGKKQGEATEIRCAYCHRGVAVPKPIVDIMWQLTRDEGVDAAITQYRKLREQYFGRTTYDFGEDPLATMAQQLASFRPDDAIALVKLNMEFYPKSINSLLAMSYAQSRKRDDDGAIATLEKALEIEPDNGSIRGRLEQLKGYRRK